MGKSCSSLVFPDFAPRGYYEIVLQHVLDLENRTFVWLDNFLGEGQPSALTCQCSGRWHLSLPGHLLRSIQLLLRG